MNRSTKTLIASIPALVVIGIACVAEAQQSKVIEAHRWALLAAKASSYDAPMMNRTYCTIAFVKHPHYAKIRALAQRPSANKTIEDTSFASYCNALAWVMITHPIKDDKDYENAKAVVLLGAQIGGVTWYSADTIATAYALSGDYDESYRWAMTSASLYMLRKDHSESALNEMKETIVNIAEMIQDRDRNIGGDERWIRESLQIPKFPSNRYPAYEFKDPDRSFEINRGYIISANPLNQTAKFRLTDGKIIRLRKSSFDGSFPAGQQYTNAVKAFMDWDWKPSTIAESLKSIHREFELDSDHVRVMLKSGFRASPDLRPHGIRGLNNDGGAEWTIQYDLANSAASTVARSSAEWSEQLSDLVDQTKAGLGVAGRQ